MAELITTLGAKREEELGMILPHEHIFANFPTGDDLDCKPEVVVTALLPEISKNTGSRCNCSGRRYGSRRRTASTSSKQYP